MKGTQINPQMIWHNSLFCKLYVGFNVKFDLENSQADVVWDKSFCFPHLLFTWSLIGGNMSSKSSFEFALALSIILFGENNGQVDKSIHGTILMA